MDGRITVYRRNSHRRLILIRHRFSATRNSSSIVSDSKKSSKPISKTICDWSRRELRDHFDQLQKIVERPKYACTKCGRAASAKKWLCKPKRLE